MEPKPSIQSRSDFIESYFFRQKIVFVAIFSFLGGVFISSLINILPLVALLVFIVAIGILSTEKIYRNEINKEVLVIVTILVSFSLGMLRYEVKDFHDLNPALVEKVGEQVELQGIVTTEPELKDNITRFTLKTAGTNSEKILVSADLYSEVGYGDEVRVSGKLDRPTVIDDGVGRSFDYPKFLSKDEIYFTLSFTKTEIISHGHGNLIKSWLINLKKSFVNRTKEILAEPHASLLSGLIVSGKESLPEGIIEEFRRAGIVHIVVLSGYNITIIADFLYKSFAYLGLRVATAASVSGILFFVIMTGAEATVTRAALMVLTVMLARKFGRSYSASRALLVVALLMVLINPKILVFDPSFQLSFLATLGLIFLAPITERYLGRVPEKFNLRSNLATTLATQITVFPFLVYSMGELSIVSLPANMLVLSVIPYTMFVGFVATLVSYIGSLIAIPFSYLAYMLLSWILGVSSVLGNFSWATIKTPEISFWLVALVYLGGVTLLWRGKDVLPQRSS